MAYFFFNQNNYASVKYDRPNTAVIETVKSSGCGVCAACNALNNLLGKNKYSVKSVTSRALKCGARTNYGTDETRLLKELSKDGGFTYTYHAKSGLAKALKSHLKKGGVAILSTNGGNSYPSGLFSTAGHLYAAVGLTATGKVKILDSGYYPGKYNVAYRKKYVSVKGSEPYIVTTATKVEKTSHNGGWLISKKTQKKPNKNKTPSYTVGKTYTLQGNMKVRISANGAWLKRSKLTANAKKYAQSGEYAVLKKGTKITCMSTKTVQGSVWMKIPSGWVCAYSKTDNKKYIK